MFHELQIFENPEAILLVASIIFFFSIIAGKAGFRFGLPALLLFLGVGMLFGSDGLGIQFSNPSAAQFIGMLALSIILFSGGMDTKMSEIKPIATEGVVLATVGVLLTTLITGGFIYYVFLWSTGYETLTVAESMLMAAVMSSTDSASVFSILRSKGVYLKQRLRPTLELESGSNDPMAYMLTLLIIAYIQVGGMNLQEAVLQLLVQLSVGAIAGFLLGKLAVLMINKINMDNESLYPILLLTTAFFTFSATTLCKGNGYLAVYIAGLVVGNAKIVHKKSMGTFFDGFAWLWQIVMFLTLGLLALSIPIVKPDTLKCPTKDIRISDHGNWRHLHWNALVSAYNMSPFFEYYEEDFAPFYEKKYEFLFDYNEELRQLICRLLDLHPNVIYTEEYQSEVPNDFREIIRPKHEGEDPSFSPKPYYQVFQGKHGFLPNMSIVDLLFNMGPEGLLVLRDSIVASKQP